MPCLQMKSEVKRLILGILALPFMSP
jgi:hypothetical protein